MKSIIKRNQIIITSLAVLIAVAGYLNYADKTKFANSDIKLFGGNKESEKENGGDELSTEEVLSQISEDLSLTKDIESQDKDKEEVSTKAEEAAANPSEKDKKEGKDGESTKEKKEGESKAEASSSQPGEAVLVNGTTSVNLVAQAKLNREQVRSSNKEVLMEIINSDSVSQEQKQSALDQMMNITKAAEKEAATENLLAAKGFEQSVVSIQDGKADVIINLDSITDEQMAQIEDIVKRTTEITIENITISTLKSLK